MTGELNLFERPAQICYCVPNSASRCAPCRERAASAVAPSPAIVEPEWIDYTKADTLFYQDDPCPECEAKLVINHYLDGCSCHINPPCSYCTEQRLVCTGCGLEIDYESA